MSETSKIQLAVVVVIAAGVVAISTYCGFRIFNTGETVSKPSTAPFKLKSLNPSDGVWGAIPSAACQALANANIYTTSYGLVDTETNLYGCSTPEIEIPNQKVRKTLQYTVTGFVDKATNIKLVMRIEGDQNAKQALVAINSWAVYSAVLAQTVFSEQLNEDEMQLLTKIPNGQSIKRNYNMKLVSNAKHEVDKNTSVYTYEIRGLPVLNGE